MPEVVIKYKKPETLKLLKSLARADALEIFVSNKC